MTSVRRPAPPGGMPPPTTVSTLAGEAIRLIPLAAEVTKRHLEQHPEDVSRYGQDLAWQWCMHDMQHVLAWAIAGLGMGLSYAPLSLIVLAEAPLDGQGAATAALQLSDVLGTALGTGVAGALIAIAARVGEPAWGGLLAAFAAGALVGLVGFGLSGRLGGPLTRARAALEAR